VCDNGIGIPSDYHRRVFEIFGRGPTPPDVNGNAVPSSGVGLALVKRIVEEHHGAVWLESAPGLGSTFFVRLPAIDNRP
jgi:signal transduction histidine kinase